MPHEIEETDAFETGEQGEPAAQEPEPQPGAENTDPAERDKDDAND